MALSTNKTGGLGGDGQVNQYQSQSQINRAPAYQKVTDAIPRGFKSGDFSYTVGTDKVSLFLGAAKGTRNQLILPKTLADYSYVSFQEGIVAPTVADNFPDDGDYGWYYDSAATKTYWTYNNNGTLINASLSTLQGTITDTQHGDRSATTTTMHAFPQISGTLSTAQHGNFSAASTNDSLHALASSTNPGFMSAADAALLAAATSGAVAGTLVKRNASAYVNGAGYNVNSVQVLTDPQTWVSVTPAGTLSRNALTTFATTYTDGITGAMVTAMNGLSAGLGTEVAKMSSALESASTNLQINSRRLGALITDCGIHGFIKV